MKMSWAVLCTVLLLATRVAAQDVRAPAEPPGDDVMTDLAVGARAPYAGILLDTDTAIRWRNYMTWYRAELALTLRERDAASTIVEESHARELEALRLSYTREIDGLRADLREQATAFAAANQPPEFWQTGSFGFAMGVVVSVLLVGAAALLFTTL